MDIKSKSFKDLSRKSNLSFTSIFTSLQFNTSWNVFHWYYLFHPLQLGVSRVVLGFYFKSYWVAFEYKVIYSLGVYPNSQIYFENNVIDLYKNAYHLSQSVRLLQLSSWQHSSPPKQRYGPSLQSNVASEP